MKQQKLKSIRDKLSILVCRKVFQRGYKNFVPADTNVDILHPLFLHTKQVFFDAFCKREVQPLYKITENVKTSKRHVISMLRRIAKYNDNYLVQKRRTIYTDGKGQSQYLYALVRI